MGRASQRKTIRRHQKLGARDLGLATLKRAQSVHVITDGPEGLLAYSNSMGGLLAGFDDESGAKAYLEQLSVGELDIKKISSVADLLDFMGTSGAVGMRFEDGSEIGAGSEIGKCLEPSPSLLFYGRMEQPSQIMNRMGSLLPRTRGARIYPWQRWDLIDNALKRNDGLFLADSWWEISPGESRVLLIAERNIFGPFPPPFGAVPFFSSREAAEDYLDALGGLRGKGVWTATAGTGLHFDRPLTRSVGSLRERLDDATVSVGVGTPVILDPGGPRQSTALGSVGSHHFRTVSGTWRLTTESKFERSSELAEYSGSDTFHWGGATTSSLPPIPKSHRVEPKEDDDSRPLSYLDSFLIVLQDRYDPAASEWLLTGTATESLRELAVREKHDLQMRGLDTRNLHWLVVPTRPFSEEQQRSNDFQEFVTATIGKIRDNGYEPLLSECIASAANQIFSRTTVRAIGWVRDLLVSSQGPSNIVDDILDMAGDERPELTRWIENNNAMPVAAEAREDLIQSLGTALWESLDPRSRHFLGSAWAFQKDFDSRADIDHSPIIVQCAKIVEVEFSELVGSFRGTSQATLEHDESNRNDSQLRGVLDGNTKLTLGNIPYFLRPKESDSPLRKAFGEFARGLERGEQLTSKSFTRMIQKLLSARNPASHDSAIDYEQSNSVWESLVGEGGVLSNLVSWKFDDTRDQPEPRNIPSAFRPVPGSSVQVANRYVPWSPNDDSLDELTWLPQLEEDHSAEDYPLLDFVSSLVETGELDFLLEVGLIDRAVASQLLRGYETYKDLQRPAKPSPGGSFLGQLTHGLLFSPEEFSYSASGSEMAGGTTWEVIRGFVIGRGEEGIVTLVAKSRPSVSDPATDVFYHLCDGATISDIAHWLERGQDQLWRHRSDEFCIERIPTAGDDLNLAITFRRNRPPGGHFPVRLGYTGSVRFSQVILRLASGDFGSLFTSS